VPFMHPMLQLGMWRRQLSPKICVLMYNAGVSKHVKSKGKGKFHPTTGHEGPDVE